MDIALHTLAAAAILTVLVPLGGTAPHIAALVNGAFWLERERVQAGGGLPKIFNWSLHKNAEWIVPSLVGVIAAQL